MDEDASIAPPSDPTPAGGTRYVSLVSSTGGSIAVRINLPQQARYSEGAPIVVQAPTFFTPKSGYSDNMDVTPLGMIDISFLIPGVSHPASGTSTDGTKDYGGSTTIEAFRDVIRFSLGLDTDQNGHTIGQLLQIPPLTGNVGIYAFSHPGIAATNVVARHGLEMPGLQYLVGRENPTTDTICSVEVGHWDDDNSSKPVPNPFYKYPENYSPTTLTMDMSSVGWLVNEQYPDGRPYFGVAGGPDYVLGKRVPTLWDKRYYSRALTQALRDNGALTEADWPADLATPEETQAHWPDRICAETYGDVAVQAPDLKVMLVFAQRDHVNVAPDFPHVHQAYDGFRHTAGLWVRLNPDRAYVEVMEGAITGPVPDNAANDEPSDWSDLRPWGYGNNAIQKASTVMPWAALAEMADRTQQEDWSNNLAAPLLELRPATF